MVSNKSGFLSRGAVRIGMTVLLVGGPVTLLAFGMAFLVNKATQNGEFHAAVSIPVIITFLILAWAAEKRQDDHLPTRHGVVWWLVVGLGFSVLAISGTGLLVRKSGELAIDRQLAKIKERGYNPEFLPPSEFVPMNQDNGYFWLEKIRKSPQFEKFKETTLGDKANKKWITTHLRELPSSKLSSTRSIQLKLELEKLGPVFADLERAAESEKFSWNMKGSEYWPDQEIPELAYLLSLVRAVALQANFELVEGDLAGGVRKLEQIQWLAQRCREMNVLIGHAVAGALDRMAMNVIQARWKALGRERRNRLLGGFPTAATVHQNTFDVLVMEQTQVAQYWAERSPRETLAVLFPDGKNAVVTSLAHSYWMAETWVGAAIAKMGRRYFECFLGDWGEAEACAELVKKEAGDLGYIGSSEMIQDQFKLFRYVMVYQTRAQLSQLANRVDEFRARKGRLPSKEKDLMWFKADTALWTDPFGTPVNYVLGPGSGFTIYSFGPDRVDDRAKTDFNNGTGKGDLSWRVR